MSFRADSNEIPTGCVRGAFAALSRRVRGNSAALRGVSKVLSRRVRAASLVVFRLHSQRIPTGFWPSDSAALPRGFLSASTVHPRRFRGAPPRFRVAMRPRRVRCLRRRR